MTEPWLKREELVSYQKHARNIRERNEAGLKRWRQESRAQRDSNLRNLVMVVR